MDISPIPPLYTDFDGDIENIFVRLILTSSRSIHRSEKRESAIFSHSRMDFTPKDRKTGSQKVKRDFVKKSALLYHIFGEKTSPKNYTKR